MPQERRVWRVPGIVVRIVDGDSIRVDLDLGWGVWYRKAPIRLVGVNSPERGETGWAEARDFVAAYIPLGTEVHVVSHKREKYGRVLADVYRTRNEADDSLSQVLLQEGHAVESHW